MQGVARTAPVTLTTSVDATNLVNLRQQFKAVAGEQGSDGRGRVGYTDIVVKLAALALQRHPILNSRWDGDRILIVREHPHRPRRRYRRRAAGPGDPRRARPDPARGRRAVAGPDRPRPAPHAQGRGAAGGHVHGHQPWLLRHRRLHADHQCSRVRRAGHGADRPPACRDRAPDRSPRSDDAEPDLRPPDRRRSPGGRGSSRRSVVCSRTRVRG